MDSRDSATVQRTASGGRSVSSCTGEAGATRGGIVLSLGADARRCEMQWGPNVIVLSRQPHCTADGARGARCGERAQRGRPQLRSETYIHREHAASGQGGSLPGAPRGTVGARR